MDQRIGSDTVLQYLVYFSITAVFLIVIINLNDTTMTHKKQ